MKYVYHGVLRDEELRVHLERGDSVYFTQAVKDWHHIERQVERLGFGNRYAVSRSNKPVPIGERAHTRVCPLWAKADGEVAS